MIGRNTLVTAVRPVLVLLAVLAVPSCTKHDSLVLLELRSSGPLGAPVVRIRLSAKNWPTRTVPGSIGPEGLLVGYYGPGDGKAVTVIAQALDAVDCVLGIGSAGVPALAAGATSAPTKVFVRPQPGNGCAVDVGTGGIDAGEPDTGVADADAPETGGDVGSDVPPEIDAGIDADDDASVAPDGGVDADDDASADAADAGDDASTD